MEYFYISNPIWEGGGSVSKQLHRAALTTRSAQVLAAIEAAHQMIMMQGAEIDALHQVADDALPLLDLD